VGQLRINLLMSPLSLALLHSIDVNGAHIADVMCHLHSIDLIQFFASMGTPESAPIHPSRHKMQSRKNNLGKRFDIFHGHPSIQGQKEIKEIKEKNNLCQGLIQVSHGHPSIQGQRKSKK
jgi:hypothetical protein